MAIIIINLSAFDFEWLEEFEDTKEPIRICKSKKDRQHNGQKTENTMAKRQTTQ